MDFIFNNIVEILAFVSNMITGYVAYRKGKQSSLKG